MIGGSLETARQRLADDEREWGLTARQALAIAAVPFVLAIGGVLAIPFRSAYRLLANEDGIAEWLQVVLLVVLVVLYVRLVILLWRGGHRGYAILFAVAAAGVFFVAGEEISWGQRLFGFATPEGLEEVNNQGESNIHNVGPLLKIFNIVVLAVCVGAMVLPILRWTIWRDRARGLVGYLFVAPLALIPAFGFPFAYRLVRLIFLPEPRYVITKYSEIAELSFYFGMVVFAYLTVCIVASRSRHDTAGGQGPPATGSS